MFRGERSSLLSSSSSSSSGKVKARDVAVRKTDRRRLLASARQVLAIREEEEDATAAAVLEAAFLRGSLVGRSLRMAGRKKPVVLYYRSPSVAVGEEEDDDAWPYSGRSQCVWIETGDDRGCGVPTVALLSALPPTALPTVTVHPAASRFLCRGADLMRAGIAALPPTVPSPPLGGDSGGGPPVVVSVCVRGNPQPFAVGWWLSPEAVRSRSSGRDDVGPGASGVGVEIATCYGDDLWRRQLPQPPPPTAEAAAAPSDHRRGGRVSDIGGAPYDAGHYGNVGFLHGKIVLPLVVAEDESGERVGEGTPQQQPAAAAEESAVQSDDQDGDGVFDDGVVAAPSSSSDAANGAESSAATGETGQQQQQQPALEVETTNEQNSTVAAPQESVAAKVPEQQQQQQSLTPEQVLHGAVCRALASIAVLPKQQRGKLLPVPMSRFYAQHVLPSRPDGTTIQLKLTRYKKFSAYVAEQVEAGLWTVGCDPSSNKHDKDPMAVLIDFDRRHCDLQDHLEEAERNKAEQPLGHSGGSRRWVLTDLYRVPRHWTPLLRLDEDAVGAANASSEERRNTGLLTAKEARALLEDYLTREGLVDGNAVTLDGPLTDALFTSKRKSKGAEEERGAAPVAIPTTITRSELARRWQAKMEPAHALVELPGNRVLKLGRGKPPVVTIEVSRRQSNKFVTVVTGAFAFYGITDVPGLATDIAHRFASSTTVRDGEKKGSTEIVTQGNLVDELEALLLGDETLTSHGGAKGSPYHLPSNAIEAVLRKGVPARKKRAGRPPKKK